MGDSTTQRKEREVRSSNGQAKILLLLVRSCLIEALPDCAL